MWHRLIDWFSDVRERYKLVRDFNAMAKQAFINGYAPTLLEARTTIGSMEYRHAFSKFMAGGFRIKALSGVALEKNQLVEIGKVVLDNEELVRKLVALGWDTLEVHDIMGFHGCKWPLKDYAKIGGFLQ
jgi:hypothetical protein